MTDTMEQTTRIRRAAALVLKIEAEMRRVGMWSAESPPPSALQSEVPFCHDTLEFHQWLQWVFLPRMKLVLEQGGPLPERSDIYPLAEHSFKDSPWPAASLLALIRAFDKLISEGRLRRH